jgi:hypothetical protein
MAGLVFGIRGPTDVSEGFVRKLTALVEARGGTVQAISTTRLLGELAEELECSQEAVRSALGEERILVLLQNELQNSKASVTVFPDMNGSASDTLVRHVSIIGEGIIVEVTTDPSDPGALPRYKRRVVLDGSPEDLTRRTQEFFDANLSVWAPGWRKQS